MNTILIRTDSSVKMGTGHLMRCLTIADALKEKNVDVHFVCRDLKGNINSLVPERGHKLHVLSVPKEEFILQPGGASHKAWLEVSWQNDLRETREVADSITEKIDWLIVDSYSLAFQWEKGLRNVVNKIMVIDDLADRNHDCDLLLDQNYYHEMGKRYDGLVPNDCNLLLGPHNALLRPEFRNIRKKLHKRMGTIHRVLVFFGGSDLDNETVKALGALQAMEHANLSVDVVIGSTNPHKEDIEKICLELSDCTCHYQIKNMAELMNSADLMFGAGGSTTWERCSLGLPAIVAGIAENQLEIAEDLAESGFIYYLGRSADTSISSYQHAFMALYQSPWMIRMLSEKGTSLVDGYGCHRVISAITAPKIGLRPAVIEDMENIFNWRNSPKNRKYFFDPEPIRPEDHKNWFISKLADPNSMLLVGFEIDDNIPVGVLRYDFCKGVALVSVYLVPGKFGRGLGSLMLQNGTRWIKKNFPQIIRIEAKIIQENKASVNAFRKAGYQKTHSTYSLYILP